jgi:hypothetical protein
VTCGEPVCAKVVEQLAVPNDTATDPHPAIVVAPLVNATVPADTVPPLLVTFAV